MCHKVIRPESKLYANKKQNKKKQPYNLILISILIKSINGVLYDFLKFSSAMCFKISLQRTAEKPTSAVNLL